MSYTLVKGTFRITNFSPDGDSVRFAPDDPDLINNLPGMTTQVPPGGSVQLRLECIDSLETHYSGGHVDLRKQPDAAAYAGRDGLLAALGFTGVVWTGNTVTACDADDQPGFILTTKGDSYGNRPVSYAFAGATTKYQDGEDVFLDVTLLKQSANYSQVLNGLAYPMYYQGAFADLRAAFDQAVATAMGSAAAGTVWENDVTTAGFSVPPFTTLSQASAVWPKLFRRVSDYFKEYPTARHLGGLVPDLETRKDHCIDLDTGSWSTLHNFIDVTNGVARLTKPVTRLMFKD